MKLAIQSTPPSTQLAWQPEQRATLQTLWPAAADVWCHESLYMVCLGTSHRHDMVAQYHGRNTCSASAGTKGSSPDLGLVQYGSARRACMHVDPRRSTIKIHGGFAAPLRPAAGRRSQATCMYVCMYDYIAVSTRTLTPPTTGTD